MAATADEAQLKQTFAAELHSIKSDLQALKSKFYDRQASRNKLHDAQAVLQALGPAADLANPLEAGALQELQQLVAAELLDPACTLPIPADALHRKMLASSHAAAYRACLSTLRQACLSRLMALLALQGEASPLSARMLDLNGVQTLVITSVDRHALSQCSGMPDPLADYSIGQPGSQQQQHSSQLSQQQQPGYADSAEGPPLVKRQRTDSQQSDDLAQLLQFKSVKERDRLEKGEELMELLDRKTARQQQKLQQYQTGGAAVREHCPHLTKEACRAARGQPHACHRLHQRKILYPWTGESLGNCSYLDTCRDVRRCKFVHYELDLESDQPGQEAAGQQLGAGGMVVPQYLMALQEPQWIRCDIRSFDFSILGKFGVIMTDPPWEIHQDLPYGTMSDHELLNMGVAELQDDGVIFMWVTGRALELGRELLAKWGYRRVDELIWVKTNSLQRLIRTGRTGHWLNHSKEHCLVGYKGNPHINRFVDCDVLVSEVRETSRKPDEMYPLLERLSPGTRKLEIFARQHNVRPGWVSLGNQLDGTWLTDPDLAARYTERYGPPQRPRNPPPPRMTAPEYSAHFASEYGGDWTHGRHD